MDSNWWYLFDSTSTRGPWSSRSQRRPQKRRPLWPIDRSRTRTSCSQAFHRFTWLASLIRLGWQAIMHFYSTLNKSFFLSNLRNVNITVNYSDKKYTVWCQILEMLTLLLIIVTKNILSDDKSCFCYQISSPYFKKKKSKFHRLLITFG